MILTPVYVAILSLIRALSPLPAFTATGANGAWLDESDFASLFQDSAGITPVTAVEQAIGLMLDKHATGGVQVSPGVYPNGYTFQAGVTQSGNTAVFSGVVTNNSAFIASSPALVANRYYLVTYAVNSITAGGFACYVGGMPSTITQTVPGTYTERIRTSATDQFVAIRAVGTTSGVVSGLVVTEVLGNHVSQATAASRPVVSSRVNTFLKTENLLDAAWFNTTTTVTSGIADPNGGTAAFRLTANGASSQLYQLLVATATNITVSMMVRRVSGTGVIRLYGADGSSFTDITASLSSGWQRFYAPVAGSNAGNVYGNIFITTSGDVIEVAFPERDQAGATKYQRVDTSTSYDTAGFPLYAACNGTNSTMASATGGGGTLGFFFCQAIAPKGRGTALATPVNAAFSTSTTGGTLAAATYFYRVVAKNAYGKTLASAETSQITTGTTSTVTVNWGAVSGATGYEVYGRTTGAELLIASVGAVTTYTDDGSITPAGALPASNTTAYEVLWSDAGSNTGYKVLTDSGGRLFLQAGNGGGYVSINSTDVLSLGVPSLITVWDDGTNLNAQVGSGTVFSVARPVVVAGTAAFTLWSDNGAATGFFYGNSYPEVYFKDTGLTAAQRLQIQNYCKSKAGL